MKPMYRWPKWLERFWGIVFLAVGACWLYYLGYLVLGYLK
jgi:hypothetical protein